MAMTVFGDVDLSTLREKPPGRGSVNTYLAHDGWKDRWWEFVRQRLLFRDPDHLNLFLDALRKAGVSE